MGYQVINRVWIARFLLPIFFCFSVLLPYKDAKASYTLFPQTVVNIAATGATGAGGLLMAYGAPGYVVAPALAGPAFAAGSFVVGNIVVGMQIGSILLCTGLSAVSSNNPCSALPTGTAAGATANANPTGQPATITGGASGTVYTTNVNYVPSGCSSSVTTYTTSLAALSAIATCAAEAGYCYSGSGYTGCSAVCTSISCQYYTTPQCTACNFPVYASTGCPSGYSVSGSNCNLTNAQAAQANSTSLNKQTTVTRSGTTLTVTIAPYSVVQNNSNNAPIAPNCTGSGSNTVTCSGYTASGNVTTNEVQALSSGGSSNYVCVDNGNSTTTCDSFSTDSSGNVTSVQAPQTTNNSGTGGGLSFSSASGVFLPSSGIPAPASGVLGSSGVIGQGASGVLGSSPSYGGGGFNPSVGTSNSTSGSGTGGCVGTLAAPCVTQSSELTGFTASAVAQASDTTGMSGVISSEGIYINSQSSVTASQYASAVASAVGAASQVGRIASSVTGTWSWFFPTQASGSNYSNCEAIWGSSGVPSIAFNIHDQAHPTQLYDPCSNTVFLSIPDYGDSFVLFSCCIYVFLGVYRKIAGSDEV